MEDLNNYNYDEPIEIVKGVYWVGFYDKDAIFSCNPYLIIEGDEAILLDAGSLGHFPEVGKKVFSLVNPSQISHLIFHHMDPDLCAALPLFVNLINRPDLKIVAHKRAALLISYYSKEKINFYYPEDHGNFLKFSSGRTLRFIPAHYLHTPGTINTYDEKNKILFSSDLFAAFTAKWELFADQTYFQKMRQFHEYYLPTREIVIQYTTRIKQLELDLICSQHGSIIKKELIGKAIQAVENFSYGRFLE